MGRYVFTKLAAGIFVVFLGIWIYSSIDYGKSVIFTKYEKPYTVVEKDEMFGTEVEKTKWKEGFWFGLLPPDDRISFQATVGLVPVSGFLFFVMVLEIILLKFKKGGK